MEESGEQLPVKQAAVDPLKGKIESLLQKRVTRRDFMAGLAGAGLGTAAIAAVGLPGFLKTEAELSHTRSLIAAQATKEEQSERKNFLEELERAKNKREQEEVLKDQIFKFLNEQEKFEQVANSGLKNYTWKVKYEKEKDSSSEAEIVKSSKEQSSYFLERGVFLLASWGLLKNGKSEYRFDQNGRLHFEGRELAVNEKAIDNLLAFNLVRARFSELIERDPEKKSLQQEDCENILGLIDLRLNIVVDNNSWIVMPQSWAGSLARFALFLRNQGMPPPQQIFIESNRGGGHYEPGYGKRFPNREQVMVLGSETDASVIFHEGGHYISDLQRAESRLIGLSQDKKFRDFQVGFERTVGKMQKMLYESIYFGKLPSNIDELGWFVSGYSTTNPVEDFAETFSEFMSNGPVFLQRIEQLRKRDPRAAGILEAKYEYMRTELARGNEFTFEGRAKRSDIAGWERTKLKSFNKQVSLPDQLDGKFVTEQLRRKDGFKQAVVEIIAPRGNFGYAITLLDPQFWTDTLGENVREVESVSGLYAIPHYELRGKINLKISQADYFLDTTNSVSIGRFIETLPKVGISTRDITPKKTAYTEESLELFQHLGIEPAKIQPGFWNSVYPPNFIDNANKLYLHFQQDEKNQEWKLAPLDVRKVRLHTKSLVGKTENYLGSHIYNPVQLGSKDVVVVLDWEGKVQEILTNDL